ncbi:MAG: cyclase family protein [Betaproteobacteria bacterium]|nr:cyclase family protein [Betaproteobacteria bacterium]
MKSNRVLAPVAAAVAMILTSGWAAAVEPEQVLSRAAKRIPSPPWSAGDEQGMANQIGAGTWMRCAWHLSQPKARSYELSYLRSNTMPKSPFSGPYNQKYKPTGGIPFSAHAFNGEELEAGAEPAAQATQMDAIGHFAFLPEPWKMQPPFPSDTATYYGGFKQSEVKPTPDSPLLKLGIEKAPPLITSAILLDAKTHVGGGKPLEAGRGVTAKDIEDMLAVQGLSGRGILPGDVVYIRTGWGDNWQDPDVDKVYYSKAPGLAYDAAKYLGDKRIVAIGLDTPFIDPVPEGMMQGKAPPAEGTPPGLPFAVHHHMLTQMGIHHIEHANLAAIANDKVWTSCTMILPLREKGGAGSAVRPVAIGVPGQ